MLSLIINSSFFEVLRKYDLQLEMQVEDVTKYILWRHKEALKGTKSDAKGRIGGVLNARSTDIWDNSKTV